GRARVESRGASAAGVVQGKGTSSNLLLSLMLVLGQAVQQLVARLLLAWGRATTTVRASPIPRRYDPPALENLCPAAAFFLTVVSKPLFRPLSLDLLHPPERP